MISTVFYERRKDYKPIDFQDRRIVQRRKQESAVSQEHRRLASHVRRYEREAFKIPVRLKIQETEISGFTHDICPEGLLVFTDTTLNPGTPMTLKFSFGENVCHLNVAGQVVFCRSTENNLSNQYAIGIKFSAIRDYEQRILTSAVQDLKQNPSTQEKSLLNILLSRDTLAFEVKQVIVSTQYQSFNRRAIVFPISFSDRRTAERRHLNKDMELERRRIEKRKGIRIPFYTYVALNYRGYRQEVASRNLSNTGLFFVTSDNASLPNVGSILTAEMCLGTSTNPIDIPLKVVYTRSFGIVHGIGCNLQPNDVAYGKMSHILSYAMSRPNPPIHFEPQDHTCNMYGVDLTVGCEHACVYCHFYQERQNHYKKSFPSYQEFPIAVDISAIYRMTRFPRATIYLSPSTDPFAPTAKELAHELLGYLLPKGVRFALSTKNIVPEKTLRLVARYSKQVGIGVGLTNLVDETRNAMVEPGCPPAKERLAHLPEIVSTGCTVDVRMDPLIPGIDDTDEALKRTIDAVAKAGVRQITASYVFSYGRFLRGLQSHPYFKQAVEHLTEKTPVSGGMAFGVPWDDKMPVYEKIDRLCRERNVQFQLCSCKDKRLEKHETPIICRSYK